MLSSSFLIKLFSIYLPLVYGAPVMTDDSINPASLWNPDTFVFEEPRPVRLDAKTRLALPSHEYDIPYGTASEIPRKFISGYCTSVQQRIVEGAWKEAQQLAMGIRGLKDYDYNKTHTQWFGSKWDYFSNPFWGDPNYSYFMTNNLARAQRLYSKQAQTSQYIYFICAPVDNEDCNSGNINAYSWDDLGVIWSNHYIVFCNRFFTGSDVPWLGSLLTQYKDSPEDQKIITWFDGNKGSVMFHETIHFKEAVTVPRAVDLVYGAEADWELAAVNNTGSCMINADSYELDAIAIYVQNYYGLSEPPKPLSQQDNAVKAAKKVTRVKSPSLYLNKPPVKALHNKEPYPNTLSPDPSKWIEFDKPTNIPPRSLAPFCRGSATTKWVPRDRLNAIIPRFCSEAERQGVQDADSSWFKRVYFDDGKDKVQLDINWISGSAWKPTQAECIERMTTIMDNCDSSADANPMNWKHGGIAIKGEVKYAIRPLEDRGYQPGTCSLSVHEKVTWTGQDAAGLQRMWNFFLKAEMKDAAGKSLGGTGDSAVEAGKMGQNPYIFGKYHADLVMTPQAQNGNYVQFRLGDLSWTSKEPSGKAHCTVTEWNLDKSPADRDIACSFPC